MASYLYNCWRCGGVARSMTPTEGPIYCEPCEPFAKAEAEEREAVAEQERRAAEAKAAREAKEAAEREQKRSAAAAPSTRRSPLRRLGRERKP